MDIKKAWAALLLPLVTVSFLGAQSLAELSKKEKERRAAIKGKKTVITNADLAKLKKKAAVTVAQAEPAAGMPGPEGRRPGVEGETPPAAPPPFTVRRAESGKAPLSDGEVADTRETLKQRWAAAQEMVELLTMKMNALWQRFYNMDDMTSRDSVQIEIGDTYQKLLKAQEDEARAKEELEAFLSNTRKDS